MMKSYYQDSKVTCKCGCGVLPNKGKRFIIGHHRHVPVGSIRIRKGVQQIWTVSKKGWKFWKQVQRNHEKYPFMSVDELLLLPKYIKCRLRKKGYLLPKNKPGQKIGFKRSPESIEKGRESLRKHPFDVLSKNKKAKRRVRKIPEYIEWRTRVFERDDWTCQKCGARNGNGKAIYLEAHHLKPFAKYPELRFDLDNGTTLCRGCHVGIFLQ